jgi:hypothetical protein
LKYNEKEKDTDYASLLSVVAIGIYISEFGIA